MAPSVPSSLPNWTPGHQSTRLAACRGAWMRARHHTNAFCLRPSIPCALCPSALHATHLWQCPHSLTQLREHAPSLCPRGSCVDARASLSRAGGASRISEALTKIGRCGLLRYSQRDCETGTGRGRHRDTDTGVCVCVCVQRQRDASEARAVGWRASRATDHGGHGGVAWTRRVGPCAGVGV